jgi:hypothetical protein
MLAHRARAVARPVEAAIAHDVLAGPEHVRRPALPAEQAWLSFRLQIVAQQLAPPQGSGISRNTVGEASKQRHVRVVRAEVRGQRLDRRALKRELNA